MLAAILCTKQRVSGESSIQFMIDENDYSDSASRQITKVDTLNGNVITTDWGFAEGRREIRIITWLTLDEYETLISFKEDNDSTFIYCYLTSIWRVIIRSASGSPDGEKIKTSIQLSVVEKLLGDGDYQFTSSSSSSTSSSSSSSSA